jgi:vesicle coat complex subunit
VPTAHLQRFPYRYASEVDIDFVRKAVRSIGRLAIKVEPAADSCIKTLLGLIETKVSYVVPEAIIVIKDIFRRYPGKYEGIIPTLCEHLDALEEPEAKAAMIWIVGQFADKIDNADELLEDLLYTFKEDPVEVRRPDLSIYYESETYDLHRSNLHC